MSTKCDRISVISDTVSDTDGTSDNEAVGVRRSPIVVPEEVLISCKDLKSAAVDWGCEFWFRISDNFDCILIDWCWWWISLKLGVVGGVRISDKWLKVGLLMIEDEVELTPDVRISDDEHRISGIWPRNSVCWVSLCLLKSTFLWNDLPQRSHENGLNPVCFRLWVMRFELWLKAFPHTLHLWGFSPEKEKSSWLVIIHIHLNQTLQFTLRKLLKKVPNINGSKHKKFQI